MEKMLETVSFAQSECTKYLSKMAPDQSYELSFEIQGSKTLENDKIKVSLSNNKIEIEANHGRAALIAVYRLLNELGVRFLSPTQEYIPEIQLSDFQFEINETARYLHRGVCIEGANSIENILDFIDYLPKIYMNSFFVQFNSPQPFLRRYYEHLNNDSLNDESNQVDYEPMIKSVDRAMAQRGLIHHRVGHGWTSNVLGFDFDLAWDQNSKINEDQKSLIAVIDGEKKLFLDSPTMTSLCLAHETVLEKLIEAVCEYALNRKDVDVLHIWLSDAFNNVCECEQCIQTNIADQYITILNEIDRAMSAKGLEHKICFLLYQELLWPPVLNHLINEDRFIMMFAPITRPFERSYDEQKEKQKPIPYQRNKISLPNGLEENLSFLYAWQAHFNKDQFVYDYPLGRAHYGDLGYLKISETIARDINYLDKMNLNGYISCQELRVSLPHGYPNYVMGQSLWHHQIDEALLREDYFESLFKEDGSKLRKYYEDLSQFSSPDYFNGKGDRVDAHLVSQFENLHHVAQQTLHLSSGNPYQKQVRYHQELAIKLSGLLLSKTKGEDTQAAWLELKHFIQVNEPVFQPLFDVYRFIEIAENFAQLKRHHS